MANPQRMNIWVPAALILLVVILGTTGPAVGSTLAEEAKALLDFKAAVKNPKSDIDLWTYLDTWEGTNPCNITSFWSGVECKGGHVTSFSFYALGTDDENDEFTLFDVAIPASFAKLDRIKYIAIPLKSKPFPLAFTSLLLLEHLHVEGLTGPIPATIGQLVRLKSLTLRKGSLTGLIPASIGKLVLLDSLVLNDNQLTGAVPRSVKYLTRLTMFNVFNNRLSLLPSEIGSAKKLVWLYVGNNQLAGRIPATIGKLKSLTYLDLSYNRFSGSIPNALAHAKNLYRFEASFNILTGSIPKWLAKISQVFLTDNFISGTAHADTYHTYDNNCLGLTPCKHSVAGQRPFAQCVKYYPGLKVPCKP